MDFYLIKPFKFVEGWQINIQFIFIYWGKDIVLIGSTNRIEVVIVAKYPWHIDVTILKEEQPFI